MKKIIFFALLFISLVTSAQEIRVAEPEFINSYNILTSDTSFVTLPKESGTIGKHQNKVKKWSKIIGGVADAASAAGVIGVATAGSTKGVITGARVIGSAAGVGRAADAVNGLAGSAGMDIIFKGGHSTYRMEADGKDVRLLIKAESNETDPMDCYRIVRFNTSKKERRIQWMEIEPTLIGSEDARKSGYVQFTGHKYGEQSYLLTIPASEVKKGEYGIVFMSIATATAVPVGTFSVK